MSLVDSKYKYKNLVCFQIYTFSEFILFLHRFAVRVLDWQFVWNAFGFVLENIQVSETSENSGNSQKSEIGKFLIKVLFIERSLQKRFLVMCTFEIIHLFHGSCSMCWWMVSLYKITWTRFWTRVYGWVNTIMLPCVIVILSRANRTVQKSTVLRLSEMLTTVWSVFLHKILRLYSWLHQLLWIVKSLLQNEVATTV